MRIFIVGPRIVGRWAESCKEALIELGHSVSLFYYLDEIDKSFSKRLERKIAESKIFFSKIISNRLNDKFYERVKEYAPDVLLLLKAEMIYPSTLENIRRSMKKTVIVSWWVDDPIVWWKLNPSVQINTVQSLSLIDHFFIFDHYYIPKLEKMGCKRVHYLPLACDPKIYKELKLTEEEKSVYGSDVSFVGTCFPEREKFFLDLVKMDLDLKIWGGCWSNPNFKKYVAGGSRPAEEVSKIYNASSIVINIHNHQSVYSPNTKAFEINACGAFQCSDKLKDIGNLFDTGKDLICYENVENLKELIKYYLNNTQERKTIAQKGQERVLRDHTYRHRMMELLKITLK